MALAFNNQGLEAAASPVADFPVTLSCWFNPQTPTSGRKIVALYNSGSDSHVALAMGAGSTLLAESFNGIAATEASVASITTNAWQHGAAVFTSNAIRDVYLNGATANDVGVSNIGAPNNSFIAELNAGDYYIGRLAEVAVWNVALSQLEIDQLVLGFSPLLIRPEALVYYLPIYDFASAGLNLTDAQQFSINGSPTSYPHPELQRFINPEIYTPGTLVLPVPSAENCVLFDHSVATNIKLATAANTVTFDDVAASNFKQEDADNTVTFDHTAEHNFILAVASNEITFDDVLDVNGVFNRAPEHTVTFDQVVDTNILQDVVDSTVDFQDLLQVSREINRSIGDTVTFDQSATHNILLDSASNTVTFDQDTATNILIGTASNAVTFDATIKRDVDAEAETDVLFLDGASPNIILLSVESVVAFDTEATSEGSEFTREATSQFLTEQAAFSTIEASASNSVTFTSEPFKTGVGDNNISFDVAATALATPSVIAEVIFNTIAIGTIVRNDLQAANSIPFEALALGYLLSNPSDFYEYTPFNSDNPQGLPQPFTV